MNLHIPGGSSDNEPYRFADRDAEDMVDQAQWLIQLAIVDADDTLPAKASDALRLVFEAAVAEAMTRIRRGMEGA